ncbi:MAG: 3-isopropylmalate dehydrogenase, partial [Treponemataceae bacterium]|nr:3-isopropylmalate dehydrogenase [Treponemataceae bacterium]
MERNIALIPGDGIGPDVVAEGVKVLDAVAAKFGHSFSYTEVIAGGAAIDKWGHPLPQDQLDICLRSDAVLLGALGGPKWDNVPGNKRPEKALLGIRSKLKLYANVRPALLFPELKSASPLKPELVDEGIDFVVVRELTGGVYFGEHKTETVNGESVASDLMIYSESEIRRIARVAFDTAMKRRKHVTCVDKANVLDSSR